MQTSCEPPGIQLQGPCFMQTALAAQPLQVEPAYDELHVHEPSEFAVPREWHV